jgi:hypothetical protein
MAALRIQARYGPDLSERDYPYPYLFVYRRKTTNPSAYSHRARRRLYPFLAVPAAAPLVIDTLQATSRCTG